MNKLEDYFYNKEKKLPVHKWLHYFDIYDRHFKRFIGKNPVILEVGVAEGGSLEMWNYYFDGNCTIYGVDINPQSLNAPNILGKSNIKVILGSQDDRTFLQSLKDLPKFDIIIDDGGHKMSQQIATYEELYDHLNDDGVYLCEDLHTSYWPDYYEGGYKKADTFIEYSKNFIDYLNAYHIRPQMDLKFRKSTHSIHYYDSIIVLERKKDLEPPRSEQRLNNLLFRATSEQHQT
jgi:hypothetical protein